MKKAPKGLKITLWVIVGLIVLMFLIAGLTSNKTTEQADKDEKAELEAFCKDIAETLNESYKPEGFVVHGSALDEDMACFNVDMPYTTEEVKTLYASDKQSLRDLWGNIARETWNHLADQGVEVPADIEVVVYVYANDNKESVVYLAKDKTELRA